MQKHLWTINRLMAAALVAGFAFLLVEIRYEHRAVLSEEAASYIPIIFSGVALVLGIIGVTMWNRGGRLVMTAVFAVAMLVGLAGIWFHSEGKPAKLLAAFTATAPSGAGGAREGRESNADEEKAAELALVSAGEDAARTGEPLKAVPEKAEGGPPLAPAAFAGLGTLGLLACSRRLHADTPEG